MANPYDVNLVYAELEQELIKSFKRNMHKYIDTSDMWQAMKMKDLEMYRREVAKSIAQSTKQAKKLSKIILKDDFVAGADKVDAFMKMFNLDVNPTTEHDFFRLNRRKLNTMLEAVYNDLDVASQAIYRQMDDVYRQTLFKAEIAKNSGVYTPEQAMDVATKDFLDKGINCIRYSNGAMVNIASYAEMVIRTSSKRAMLTAEGLRNQEWGVTTIQITQHGSTCPLCSPWQGRVLIDDVYSGGKAEDGPYPLLSHAMEEGLFHPNCRHGSGTYFEGVSDAPAPYDQKEVEEKYKVEQQQRYNERKIREWKRKANGSMDEANKRKAEEKVKYWQGRQRQLMKDNDWLRRNYSREGIKGIGLEKKLPKVEPPKPVPKAEDTIDLATAKKVKSSVYQEIAQKPFDAAKGFTVDKLSGAEIEGLEYYIAPEGFDMNQLIRDKSLKGYTMSGELNKSELSKAIEDVKSAINKSTVAEDMIVYRGAGIEALEQEFGMSVEKLRQNAFNLSGKTISHKGFISTSPDKAVAEAYSNKVLYNILLPKGSKAMSINKVLGEADSLEVTLNTGSKFIVDSVGRGSNDTWVINMRLKV